MSLTEYTRAWSLLLGIESRRWHLKEKLLLREGLITSDCERNHGTHEESLSSTNLGRKRVCEAVGIMRDDVNSLNSDSAFNTSHCEAAVRRCCEAGNNACLPLQWRDNSLDNQIPL